MGTWIFICKFIEKDLDDCTPIVDKWLFLGKTSEKRVMGDKFCSVYYLLHKSYKIKMNSCIL